MASSGASPVQSEAAALISKLSTTIRGKIESVAQPDEEGSSRVFHSIFRVPRNLREVDPKAYEPQIVSIGPYHHGKVGLEDMEMHKCRILSYVLNRSRQQMENCLEDLVQLEDKARRSYAEPLNRMESSEFIEMMLLDACFVIEFLRLCWKGFEEGNPFLAIRTLIPYIERDLLMVENQLPFSVLNRLFELTYGTVKNIWPPLPELALKFFDSLIPRIAKNLVSNSTQEPPHLLALLHYSLCAPQSSSGQHHQGTADSSSLCWAQSSSGQDRHGTADISRLCWPRTLPGQDRHGIADSSSLHMVHSVTRLRVCGVIFRKKMTSNNLTDVDFEKGNGVLKIPPLLIHDSSKTIFLNLMAFEEGWPYCFNHVTSYLCFMDNLINTSQDVRHLCHKGIIDHALGSEEHVARLFNDLRTEFSVDLSDCYLTKLAQDLNRYAEKKRHGWRASLKHEYFRHPWAIIGLVVGFMILLLSFTQTFYTVLAYYYPRSR